jgi:large subunit ribosomal protein L24
MKTKHTNTHPLDIKKGDEVLVLTGKDASYKGHQKRGKVIGALPREGRLLVEGVNLIKRAVRQGGKLRQGGIITSPGHIARANVMLVCPQCDKPTRISRRVNEHGEHVRVCKHCKKDID